MYQNAFISNIIPLILVTEGKRPCEAMMLLSVRELRTFYIRMIDSFRSLDPGEKKDSLTG